MVRCTKGLKGIKGAGALILAFSLTFAYPAVSWAVETEASEGTVTYGPGSYVVGEDILPGEYAVFTEDTSEQNAYSTCTITLYKDDTDERRIGTFQFQHHGLITLYKGQHLVITKGYAVRRTGRASPWEPPVCTRLAGIWNRVHTASRPLPLAAGITPFITT